MDSPRSTVHRSIFAGVLTGLTVALALVSRSGEARPIEQGLSTDDLVLPAGYTIEPMLTGLTYPSSMVFGPDGSLCSAASPIGPTVRDSTCSTSTRTIP